MTPDFEGFPDIKKLGNARLWITQKIHGSNAQIYVFQQEDGSLDLACGSRTQWIVPGKDNFGFAEMVYANKQEFIDKLGPGRHYGEWAGPGINSGEGLTKKIFVLFDHWRYPVERPLPPNTCVVPVLYEGDFDMGKVQECLNDLKTNGSRLVKGFMAPEGVVVRIKGERYKVVFQAEDAKWKSHKDPVYAKEKDDKKKLAFEKFGHLLQPMRLEKLLSRDETYLKEYPKSMGKISKDYFADLIKEDQVTGTELEIQGIQNQVNWIIYPFIQEIAEKQKALTNV
jgi:hypothetical protein